MRRFRREEERERRRGKVRGERNLGKFSLVFSSLNRFWSFCMLNLSSHCWVFLTYLPEVLFSVDFSGALSISWVYTVKFLGFWLYCVYISFVNKSLPLCVFSWVPCVGISRGRADTCPMASWSGRGVTAWYQSLGNRSLYGTKWVIRASTF